MKRNVIILGAAGRDFHNFNVFFRDNDQYEVKAFTAFQIPNIADRKYPAKLSGSLYPDGIPIYEEKELPSLIKKLSIDVVVFAYSDLCHEDVMHRASIVNAAGADFWLLGYDKTAITSTKPLISVCAVRTGAGKSETSTKIVKILQNMNKKVITIRHPMPYGNLELQDVQRFATLEDLDKHQCTIEEMEEYEPYVKMGAVIYAGVDYEKILREAEKEADIILWDGGNNDMPFYKSDFQIVLADATRPYHEISYYPGETNIRMADVVIINKQEISCLEDIDDVRVNIQDINPDALIMDAACPPLLDQPNLIKGKRVLVVEDGPTVTHGELPYDEGYVAARKMGAIIVDPRPFAVGDIKEAYEKYPHMDDVVPALGYSKQQMKDLQDTINNAEVDVVVLGTPVDLRRLFSINKPCVTTRCEVQEIGQPTLEFVLKEKFGGK